MGLKAVHTAGLDIATVSVAFATEVSPFATKTSSAVANLRPFFSLNEWRNKNLKTLFPTVVKIWKM